MIEEPKAQCPILRYRPTSYQGMRIDSFYLDRDISNSTK
jgi:hypothetical protein